MRTRQGSLSVCSLSDHDYPWARLVPGLLDFFKANCSLSLLVLTNMRGLIGL